MENFYDNEVIFEFLSRFYEQCDFTRIPIGSAPQIGKDMGLTHKQSMDIANSLVKEGYFTHRTMGGSLKLTKRGERYLKDLFGQE